MCSSVTPRATVYTVYACRDSGLWLAKPCQIVKGKSSDKE